MNKWIFVKVQDGESLRMKVKNFTKENDRFGCKFKTYRSNKIYY